MNNQALKVKTIRFDQFRALSSEERMFLLWQKIESFINLSQEKFLQIMAILQPKDESPLFKDMARAYLDSKAKPDKNFKRALEDVLIPKLGRKTLQQINKKMIVKVLGKKVKYTTISNALRQVTKKLDIGFQLRDLRAKGATEKAKRCGIIEAQRQLGHDSAKLTANVYVRNEWGDTVTPTC